LVLMTLRCWPKLHTALNYRLHGHLQEETSSGHSTLWTEGSIGWSYPPFKIYFNGFADASRFSQEHIGRSLDIPQSMGFEDLFLVCSSNNTKCFRKVFMLLGATSTTLRATVSGHHLWVGLHIELRVPSQNLDNSSCRKEEFM
jgi:hypothetical protein